jgi:hypothetical protein
MSSIKDRITAMVAPHLETAAANIYAECPLLNGKDLHKWIASICPTPIPINKLHSTVLYSTDNVDLSKVTQNRPFTIKPSRSRKLKKLGDSVALVLDEREARPLADIWEMFRKAGASWDFPSFIPHVSISYNWSVDQGELDLINAYEGPLNFGIYKIEPIKD